MRLAFQMDQSWAGDMARSWSRWITFGYRCADTDPRELLPEGQEIVGGRQREGSATPRNEFDL